MLDPAGFQQITFKIMHAHSVPGWMHPKDLDVIKLIASQIPKNGVIVEVGSWLGQSTCAWAEHTSAKIYAIDLWKWMPKEYKGSNGDKVDLLASPYSQFISNISRYDNVTPLQRNSSGVSWEFGMVDLVFIDAMHQAPFVDQDIRFWEQWVKSGGIICGDDYADTFPAVQEGAQDCANRFEVDLDLPGHKFWCVKKP